VWNLALGAIWKICLWLSGVVASLKVRCNPADDSVVDAIMGSSSVGPEVGADILLDNSVDLPLLQEQTVELLIALYEAAPPTLAHSITSTLLAHACLDPGASTANVDGSAGLSVSSLTVSSSNSNLSNSGRHIVQGFVIENGLVSLPEMGHHFAAISCRGLPPSMTTATVTATTTTATSKQMQTQGRAKVQATKPVSAPMIASGPAPRVKRASFLRRLTQEREATHRAALCVEALRRLITRGHNAVGGAVMAALSPRLRAKSLTMRGEMASPLPPPLISHGLMQVRE
jgi:hypothetical protein